MQGPPLADNLRRYLLNRPLRPFFPQSTYLNLISAGDKYCVAVKGRLGLKGRLLWRLKDRIDRGFMQSYAKVLDP